jgi:hypothetical protein
VILHGRTVRPDDDAMVQSRENGRPWAPFQSLHQDRRAHIDALSERLLKQLVRGEEIEEGPPPRRSRSLGSLEFCYGVICDLAPELIGMLVGRPGVDTAPDAHVDDLFAHFCEGLP